MDSAVAWGRGKSSRYRTDRIATMDDLRIVTGRQFGDHDISRSEPQACRPIVRYPFRCPENPSLKPSFRLRCRSVASGWSCNASCGEHASKSPAERSINGLFLASSHLREHRRVFRQKTTSLSRIPASTRSCRERGQLDFYWATSPTDPKHHRLPCRVEKQTLPVAGCSGLQLPSALAVQQSFQERAIQTPVNRSNFAQQ